MKTKEYTSWETLQKLYPDNPVHKENIAILQGGTLLYKHRSKMKVVEKEHEMKPSYAAKKFGK